MGVTCQQSALWRGARSGWRPTQEPDYSETGETTSVSSVPERTPQCQLLWACRRRPIGNCVAARPAPWHSADMRSAKASVTAGGLHYSVQGGRARPVLLFLHGFMGCAGDWDKLIAEMRDEARCIVVDLPGHGRSVNLTDPGMYAVTGLLGTLTSLLNRENIGECAVVGYSMGARLAVQWAISIPDRIRGILLESGSPGLRTEEERRRRRRNDSELAHRLVTHGLQDVLDDWYGQGVFASLASKPLLRARLIAQRLRNNPAELARALTSLGAGQHPYLWPAMCRLRCPIHAVTGMEDPKYIAVARKLAGPPLHAPWTSVPDAGHNVHAEQPDAFVHILRGFLRGLPPARSGD
jgi:2-succinyl-6-hydroxy-2,4-cyclohexadiene-1-carboxylate synthase